MKVTKDIWTANRNFFLECMSDDSQTVVDYFQDKIVFNNVMCNMYVDCDCCTVDEDFTIADIGILCSTDQLL